MTITLTPAVLVDDFRRYRCPCRHCKGPSANPTERHRQGAPIVSDPDTGKDTTYRRPSSMGGPLENTYSLDLWKKRTVLYGTAITPAIAAQAANLDPSKDKAALDELAEAAIKAAKGTEASELGTEMHLDIERINLGIWTIDDVPAVFRADVEAYIAELERHGLRMVDGHAELKVVNDIIRAAGTFDMVLTDGTTAYVGDLKTGKVDLGQVGIGVQLATYQRSQLYHVPTGTRSPMPSTDADTALVVHLPYGSGTCRIIDVDIRKGWEAAQLAAAAKSWNYRKDLFTDRPAAPTAGTAPVEAPCTASPGDADGGEPSGAAVRKPRKRKAAPKVVPTAPIEPVVVSTWTPPDEGPMMDDDDIAALRTAAGALDPDAVRRIKDWQRDAGSAGRPIATQDLPSARRFEISRAMLALSVLSDERVRDLITIVMDDEVQPAVTIGCALGSLTQAEAHELAHIARCEIEPPTFDELARLTAS